MSAPRVIVQEYDKSDYVDTTSLFSDVYAGMVLPAVRGPIDEAVLVTSKMDFLNKFTTFGRIEVGYDLGYYSAIAFLSQGNKLWIRRAVNGTVKYSAAKNVSNAVGATNTAITDGIDKPEDHIQESDEIFTVIAKDPGAWSKGNIGYKLYVHRKDEEINSSTGADSATDIITTEQVYSTGEPVRLLLATGSTLPAPLTDSSVYYTIETTGGIKLAKSLPDANAGTSIDITTSGTGTFKIIPMVKVPDEDSFVVEVYRSDSERAAVESLTVSRIPTKMDGYGRNIYIENVGNRSGFISFIDNTLVLEDTLPKPQASILWLDGGTDGLAVTTSNMILAAQEFESDVKYPLLVLMDAGWAVPSYQIELDRIAKFRGDCVAILSTPFANEDDFNYLNKIVDYKLREANISSSYSAMYTPHVLITDPWNDRDIYVSPDGYAAGAIAYTAQNYEVWYPPAGHKRGVLSVTDLRRRFTENARGSGEMDYIYDNSINPVRYKPGGGIIIWGQKTTQDRPTALDRLNVRLLCIVIEKGGKEALEGFLFELNESTTRYRAKVMIDDFMESIRARKGVYDYKTVCDDSNNSPEDIDNNRLNVDLYIKPTKSIEFINFRVVITRTGADFNLVRL